MNKRILIVDDDPNIFDGYKRSLRHQFEVSTTLGGESALAIIYENKAFAVIVSDMAMPGMNGVQFLAEAKELVPDSVRIMLTGHADQDTAINAVNDGNIFRFLTKPCPDDIFTKTLEAGMDQYKLKILEKELLEKTLNGSIKVLTEILSLYHPEIFCYSVKLKGLIQDIAKSLNIPAFWEMEVAAMLAPIGFVGIPPEIISKVQNGEDLSSSEQEILARNPEIGARLLANIPRLEPVSKIIYYQNKRYDGTGFPKDSVSGEKILFGARLLKILSDLIQIESNGISRSQAVQQLKSRYGWYDPKMLETITTYLLGKETSGVSEPVSTMSVSIKELEVGQILRSDIETAAGALLLSAGQRLSLVNINRLRNYAEMTGIKEPIQVEITIS